MGTSTSPKVRTKPDTISCSWVELAPRTSPIDGSATFTFVMSRIVIAATETHTQNARQRAAGEIGMTAVVAGTARAVLVVFGDLDSDSGIVPRLAPITGVASDAASVSG